jgi:ankyrin repeat protein
MDALTIILKLAAVCLVITGFVELFKWLSVAGTIIFLTLIGILILIWVFTPKKIQDSRYFTMFMCLISVVFGIFVMAFGVHIFSIAPYSSNSTYVVSPKKTGQVTTYTTTGSSLNLPTNIMGFIVIVLGGAVTLGGVHFLLKTITAINEERRNKLLLAIKAGDLELTANLLNRPRSGSRQKAYVNRQDKNDETPLTAASSKGYKDIASLLIEKGADVNLAGRFGWTPLMEATSHPDMVKLLIAHGADVQARSHSQETAIRHAAFGGNLEAMQILIEHGADVNAHDKYNSTPFMQAIKMDNAETARYLLRQGADINAALNKSYGSSYGGCTPLIYAVRENKTAMAKLLVEQGADINRKDDSGSTALMYAVSQKQDEMVSFLKGHGEP